MNYGILNISTHIAYILFSFTEKSWLKTSSNSITMQTLYQLVWFCFFECVHCNKVCFCLTFTQSLCVLVFLNVSGHTFFSLSVCSKVICCYLENKSKMVQLFHIHQLVSSTYYMQFSSRLYLCTQKSLYLFHPRLSEVSPTLPLKQFQYLSD